MPTLIISDLHLGSTSGSDLLRREELREPLLAAVSEVDRVVLLGDVLELRHGPPREALAAARPFLTALGRALGDGQLIVVAGNHDHALIEPWLARRAEQAAPLALGVEQLVAPDHASPILERIAEWAAPARLMAAYPGLWLRPDVYATHGHYLDCHLTVPTLERLSIALMSRMLGRPAERFTGVEDYEAVSAPLYAWRQAVAMHERTGKGLNGIATVNAWRALRGANHDPADARDGRSAARGARSATLARGLRTRALVAGFPLAVAALNRAGLGPLHANVSAGELRRAGLVAMGEVARRLGLADAYVVFGHTHRAGPLPGDVEAEWSPGGARVSGAGGLRLVNSGCWTYDPVFLTAKPGESPYWPGACVLVGESGPPQLLRLLLERTHVELGAPRELLRPGPA